MTKKQINQIRIFMVALDIFYAAAAPVLLTELYRWYMRAWEMGEPEASGFTMLQGLISLMACIFGTAFVFAELKPE